MTMHIYWTTSRNEELEVALIQEMLEEMRADPAITVVSRYHQAINGVLISTTDLAMGHRLLEVNEVRGRSIRTQDVTMDHAPRCLIRNLHIREWTADSLLQKLRTQGVTEVRKTGGNNGTFILKMNHRRVVPFVWVGYTKMTTYPYIPRPQLCRRCYSYGHTEPECHFVLANGIMKRRLG